MPDGLTASCARAASLPLLLCCCLSMAWAEETPDVELWGLCNHRPVPDPLPYPQDGKLRVFADSGLVDRAGVSSLIGNARLFQDNAGLFADRLDYEMQRERVEASGNVRLELSDGLNVTGTHGYLFLDTKRGRFFDTQYELTTQRARGQASTINARGPQRLRLTDASYTTCDPEREDWILRAERVDLDRERGRGVARNTVLRFKGVPLFYTPWVDFPIDDQRKTGLLLPSFGTSNTNGLHLELPVYLNLAPNRDATLTPRFMEKRGTMLLSEYRYLTPNMSGELQLDYLPSDSVYGDDRSLFAWSHAWNISERLSFNTFGTEVSDESFMDDFGGGLAARSATHLERMAQLVYREMNWNAAARVQDFQELDVAPSYRRLPQLMLEGDWPDLMPGMDYSLRAEWVAFDRRDSLTAQRTDLMPGIRMPFAGPAWFVTPGLKYRFTHYTLDDQDQDPRFAGVDSRQSRSLPIVSLDSGLFFDRDLRGNQFQTLEPRVFYLYTPYENQDDIPIFDSSAYEFNFDQLFRDDAFSGPDRVADANQLTTALTSRIVDRRSGQERFRASIGQIQYFSDRRVSLTNAARDRDSSSSYVAETAWRPLESLNLRWSGQWDNSWENFERTTANLQYRKDDRSILNLAYRYRIDEQEQVDLSFVWPLSTRWSTVGRWAYSLDERKDLETFLGLEYQSCCWAFRVVDRRTLNFGQNERYEKGIYLQLIFKGLGSVGQGIGRLLTEGILGYEADY